MAGIALKGQCDLVSIMVPPNVSIKEKVCIQGMKITSHSAKSHTKLNCLKVHNNFESTLPVNRAVERRTGPTGVKALNGPYVPGYFLGLPLFSLG